MPIETYTLPESMQLVVRILPSDNDPDSYDSQILSGFIESIPVIKRSASDRSLYFQTFSIAPPPRKQMLEIGKSAKSWTPPREFDPWNATTRAFWARVARNPDLHQQIKSWLDQVLHMLERVNKMGRATEGLWELDETQFAEPAISVLAIAHPDFVPYYARFLTVWDMHHEVTQKDVISQIFASHGITEATENLLIARIVDGVGQYGYDNFHEMLPLLQEHYGKIEGTDFYKRMAAYHHAASVSSYARVLQNKFDNYRYDFLRDKNPQLPKLSELLASFFPEGQPKRYEGDLELFEDLKRKQ